MDPLKGSKYTIRKKIIKLMGEDFEIFDNDGNLVLFAHQKAFRLKEGITLYSDKEQSQELYKIQARSIIDLNATYDLFDLQDGEKLLGSFKRSGLKSFMKDEWTIFDSSGAEIAKLHEDSLVMALVRRFITNLIPQTFHLYNPGMEAFAEFHANFNPFVVKFDVDFSYGIDEEIDKRLGIALAVLLAAIEGKQG